MASSSNVFRQQQRWTPMNLPDPNARNQRLVALQNCEHPYNNMVFDQHSNQIQIQQQPQQVHPSFTNHQSYENNNNFNTGNYIRHHQMTCKIDHEQAAHYQKYTNATNSPSSKKNSANKSGHWPTINQRSNLVSIKSKIGVEFRRYAVLRDDIVKFDDFFKKVESIHQLFGTPTSIYYSDQDGEMLPINNDDNLAKAIEASSSLKTSHTVVASNNNILHQNNPYAHNPYHQQCQQVILERPYLKLFLEKKGIPSDLYYFPSLTMKGKRKDNLINMLMPSSNNSSESRPRISMPEDFRQISSIIDADILPATRRRVVLKRGGSDKPLGFYIRDGTYHKMNAQGEIEKNYGIFVSRLVPGGLAESTNLLAEDDEILEVNGIEVGKNKRLDQVRDMMVANSSNLIITTRPAKPFNTHQYNRLRNRHINNFSARDRLPSNQSTSSDLQEDIIRHHMY